MSTNVKFFNSSMPGAPQVSGTAGTLLAVLSACLVDGFGLQSASSTVIASGVCTLTLPTTPAMQVGSVALIAGATPASLNGEHYVTAITANSIKFASAEADQTATGTITVKLAPAGWLKPFTGTNKAAFKIDPALHPDSTTCHLRISDTGTYCAQICGYEDMTDIDTGVGQFPTATQTNLWVSRSDSAGAITRPWLIVCDSRMVYVGVRSYSTNDLQYGPAWWCFGEYKSKKAADPWRFMVSGNYSTDGVSQANYSNSITSTNNSVYTYTARSYTGLGVGVLTQIYTWPLQYTSSGAGPLPYPNGPDYGLYLCKAHLYEQSPVNLRGEMPGMLMIPHNVLNKICPDAKTAYLDTAVPGYSGKTVGFMPCSYTGSAWGVVAFDLTGPWEH